jgi:magnesium-transporting ATPase (P-type)
MKHKSVNNKKNGWLKEKIDVIFLVCLAINIVVGLIYSLLFAVFLNGNNFLNTFVYHMILFSPILPHFLYLGNNILLIYFSLFKQVEAEIRNYSNIHTLGELDFAILANTGVLNSGKLIIEEIVSESAIYDMKENM